MENFAYLCFKKNRKIMTKIKWLDTEYCGSADETVQPVLINGSVWYTYYSSHGYQYLFATIYQLHLHWSGVSNQYFAVCETEEELNALIEKLEINENNYG